MILCGIILFMNNSDLHFIISLISHIHSDAASFLQVRLQEKGLPDLVSSHGNILFQLSLVEKLTMSILAKKINRDKSTTTVLAKKLEKEGYVIRESSAEDNRVTFVRLSDKGREYTKITNDISKELINTCYTGFSREEQEQLYTLLKRVEQNFDEKTEK